MNDRDVNHIEATEQQLREATELLAALLVPMEEEWAEGIVDNYRRRAGLYCMEQARAFLRASEEGTP